jgi:putative RecB family exonuclease
MNLQELRALPHLSASSISTYVDCSLMFKFAYVDRIQPEFTADALVFGTVIHRVLEIYHHMRMVGEKISLLELTSHFEEKWREAVEKNPGIRYREGYTFDNYLISGKSLLATYYTEQPETGFKLLALEKPFSYQLTGLPVPIIGAIDMVEEDESGTIIITDHKTSSKAYSADEVDGNFQLTLYGIAAKANGYSDREIILKLDCLVKTQKPKFTQYYTVRSEMDEQRAIRKILAVWEGISKGVFIPNDNSWRCKGCTYREHCQEWFSKGGD